MTNVSIELTEDAFDALYPLVPNHLNPSAGWARDEGRGRLFETYGEQLEFVRQQDPRTIWTLVDGDDGDQYVMSGYHLANRVGYLFSTLPVPEGVTVEVRIPMQGDYQITTGTTHTPGPWDCDLDFIVAPDPYGRHPDIYIAEIASSDEEGRVASDEQQIANRQLITAAPELLAACQRAFHVFENDTPRKCEVLALIGNAIGKATAA